MRSSLIALLALIIVAILGGTGWAQSPAPDLPPAKAKQFLELLNDPEVKAWLEGKAAAPAEEADTPIHETISAWEAGIRNRIGALVNAIPRIPEELANAAGVVSRDVNFGQPGLVAGILAVLLAIGFGAEWLVRRALGGMRTLGGRTTATNVVLLELVCLLTFALASAGSFLAFNWPPLLRRIVLVLLLAFVLFRAVRAVTRWVLAFHGSGGADDLVVPIDKNDETAAFWFRRVSLIAGILLFGWAIVSFMPALGFSIEVRRLTAFLLGLGILAIAIEIVWRRPGRRPSRIVCSLQTLFLVALWFVWVAGMLELLWLGIFALILPAAVRGAGDIVQKLDRGSKREGILGVMLDVLMVRGARAAVIVAAVAWLAYVWRIQAANFTSSATGTMVVTGLLHAVVILLVADLLWQLSKALIEHKLKVAEQVGGSPDEIARHGRLRTLLPIFRNVLAVFIAVVAVLTILSGLGVQILPLIAGAGIFGVAIGFGSQTLVKDVLSGVFYMLDDAFRVGEYIQSGSYKGTVESFSLRSVRLRHHRGPVYTVPFGQLGAIQNMSRDWVIEKMTIGVTYDSDVELARKLIKKIGQELAADPEFAADTMEPLKMQGIDNFGDYAIVLRMKLKTKPGTQFGIKRRAYVMIKKAFEENGIKIAVPTVHVEGGAEGVAASHEIVRKKQAEAAAEAAAAAG